MLTEERPGHPDRTDRTTLGVLLPFLLPLHPPHVRVFLQNVDGWIRPEEDGLLGVIAFLFGLYFSLRRIQLLLAQSVVNLGSRIGYGELLGRAFEVELGLQVLLEDDSAGETPVTRFTVILNEILFFIKSAFHREA